MANNFNVEQLAPKYNRRFDHHEIPFRVTFAPADGSITNLGDYIDQIRTILDRIITDVREISTSQNDMISILLAIDNSFIPIQTTWVHMRDYNHELVFEAIEKVYQSNKKFIFSPQFHVYARLVKEPRGGTNKRSKNIQDVQEARLALKSIKQIEVEDGWCMPAAVWMAKQHADNSPDFIKHNRTKRPGFLLKIKEYSAEVLGADRNLAAEQGASFDDLQKFQDHLGNGYHIKVFTFANPKREFHWGSKLNETQPKVGKDMLKRINLMYHDNHFDVITKLGGYFSASGFCHECNKGYHDVRAHRCVEKCFGCQRVKCLIPVVGEPEILCNDCNRYFKHQDCFDYHKSVVPPIKVSQCRRIQRCRHCQRLIVQKGKKVVKHTCGEIYCKCCKSLVPQDHQCYIATIKSCEIDQVEGSDDEGDIGEERAVQAERKAGIVAPPTIKETAEFRKAIYAYYDCEAYLDDNGQHNCNLVVVRWNNNEKIFKGDNASVEFCKWAIVKDHSDWTFIAHNAKRYDNYFIMNYLTTNLPNIPTIISNGGSVMLIQIQAYSLRFIDSCCFIPRPLAKLPSMFGIQDTVKKGFFPHKFNRPINYDYDGAMPDILFYDPENMNADRRQEFETWYQERIDENYNFVFWEELISYCRDDVRVLQECVGIYRKETFDMTNIDPLTKITLASACNAIYRKNFMPANSIGIIPSNGYDKHNMQSREALIWLEWKIHKTGLDIRHAHNGNEEVVHVSGRKYMLDGKAELPNGDLVAFEFNGCYYHGCPTCYTPDTHNTLKLSKMGDLHRSTIDKEKFLKTAGWTVHSIWECEFKKQQTTDPELKDFYANYDHSPPINPRDAFFGGRTEAVKLYHRISGTEKLSYMDINSLYPWVQKTQKFPTGHPTIIRGDQIGDIADYFGLIKCRIIPPTNLYHPVLPMHIGKKLKFVLCFKCAESNNIDDDCTHTGEERCLEGTWTSVELEMALKLGYQITKVFEVWHFEESSTDLFAGYVRLFSKEKIQSKGYPSWVQTEAHKDEHIKAIRDHEGIDLEKDKIARNPGREAIAKLCLNTLWGKFGQRDNLGQTKFVRNAAELWSMFTSDQFKIKDVVFPSDMLAQVTFAENTEFVVAGINTNVVIAAFTTAYARLKLYQSVLPLHKQVCYMDTDSVVFIDPNPDDQEQYRPPVGEHLGVYKDEVGDTDTMIEFATAGPKNYSFRTANGHSTTKVKGITLNEATQQGGLKAVVWTDAFQAVIMYGGLMAIIIQGLISVGGISEAWSIAWDGGRITTDWTLNPFVYMNFWVVFFGTAFGWMAIYGTNQSSVQRYCSMSTLKRAKLSIIFVLPGALLMVPLVYSCGLVMYSYYATCDPLLSKQISNRDQLIPYFTIDILGHVKGIPGIFVSALFGGTLSTVSSGLNSLAAVTWEDFMRVQLRRRVNIDEKKATQITKGLVICYGIIGMALSYIAPFLGGVLQAMMTLMSVFDGPIAGIFLFGIMFPWGNSKGAISGLVGSAGIMMWICIGAQINKPYRASLPRSISGCSDTTLHELSHKLLLATNSTNLPEPVTNPTITGVAYLYTLSYKFYSLAPILLVFFIGIPISLITIKTLVLSEDTKKLIWPGWWTLFKCLPASAREKYNLNEPRKQTLDESDERGHFEMVESMKDRQKYKWEILIEQLNTTQPENVP